MLSQPPATLFDQRQSLKAIYPWSDPDLALLGIDFVFPITAIRRFATERNLRITPLPASGGVLWITAPAMESQK